MKRIKPEKATGYKSVKSMFRAMERESNKFKREHPILDALQTFYYRVLCRLADVPRDNYRAVKRFIQRGTTGFAVEDTWCLSGYLAKVVVKSLSHFKKNSHGIPNDLTEGEWIDILNKMMYTFETAERIGDDLYLIRDPKQREQMQKTLNEINKQYKTHDICLSPKSIKAYDEGWQLFKKHFHELWD